MKKPLASLAVLLAIGTAASLLACKPKSPATTAPKPPASAESPSAPAATDTAPTGSVLIVPGDGASLRRYLETTPETPAKRFDVEWNPEVVRIDRGTAARTLRAVSADGRHYTFDAGEPVLTALKPGKIMALWGVAVRRVTDLREANGILEIDTANASLSEIFTRADIEIEFDLRPTAPLVVPHVQEPAPAPAPAARANPARSHFILARYDAGEEPPAPTPSGGADAGGDQQTGDESTPGPEDYVIPLGLDTWAVKNFHNFDITAKYGPGGDGIVFDLQARLVQSDLSDDSAGSDQSPDKKAGKAVGNDFRKAEEEQRKRKQQDIREGRPKSAADQQTEARKRGMGGAKDWDNAKKNVGQPARDKARDAAKLLANGSGLWDLRVGASGNLHATSKNDTLRLTSNIVIRDSSLALMRTDFDNVRGDLTLFFIARRGEETTQWINKFKVELPVRFNIPVIMGGLPFMFQVAFNFIAQPALTTKHDSFTGTYRVPFDGNGHLTLDHGKLTTSGTLKSVPQVVESLGSSIGVSAVLIGIQAPRVGFGLGLFATSSVAYIDLVNTFTITSGGMLGMFPCKNHQLVSTVNAGIDTQIAFPLEGWAKILNTAVTDTLDKISKAASARQQVFKKEWYRTEPDIKACHIG